MLYAFGSNGSGQLGVGHIEDLLLPAQMSLGTHASHGEIKHLVAGGNHTIALFENGTLKATGNNEDGRCGVEGAHSLLSFVHVEPPVASDGQPLKVKQMSATWSATIILCDDGRLYVCGTGNSGETGLGDSTETAAPWQMIPAFPPHGTSIVHIASSMAHTVAVLSNGGVYGWGKGRKGQLGEPAVDVWSPRKISGFDFVATKAACGKDFTVVVGESTAGRLAVLGSSGNDRFGIRADAPSHLAGWTEIAASWCSIYALKASGEVVAWGRNDHGQLPPTGLPEILVLVAGSEHCVALTKAGKVLAWGWGEHGNCGSPTDDRGDVKAAWNEIEVRRSAVKVFAGCATSFILTEEEESDD